MQPFAVKNYGLGQASAKILYIFLSRAAITYFFFFTKREIDVTEIT